MDNIFSPNSNIDEAITMMISEFDESSKRRIRKAIRSADRAAKKHKTENCDANARNIFRELIPAYFLNRAGFDFQYDLLTEGLTPDWTETETKQLLECFTFQRGGTSDFYSRVGSVVGEKCQRYSIFVDSGYSINLSVYVDFLSGMELGAIEFDKIKEWFDNNPRLESMLFHAEIGSVRGINDLTFVRVIRDELSAMYVQWPFNVIRMDGAIVE